MRGLATALVLSVAAALPAAAQSDDVMFGLRAGVVELDCIDVDGAGCLDTNIGYSGGVFLDYGLSSRIWGGLYADVHGIGIDGADGGEETEAMLDVGATLKATVGDQTRRVYFRPGLGIGYGMIDVGESAQLLTTRATLEIDIPQAGGTSWMVEGGVYYAPMGSVDEADVTFGPGFLLRAGILF